MEYRVEHDSMGEVRVPADKYWGAQTAAMCIAVGNVSLDD